MNKKDIKYASKTCYFSSFSCLFFSYILNFRFNFVFVSLFSAFFSCFSFFFCFLFLVSKTTHFRYGKVILRWRCMVFPLNRHYFSFTHTILQHTICTHSYTLILMFRFNKEAQGLGCLHVCVYVGICAYILTVKITKTINIFHILKKIFNFSIVFLHSHSHSHSHSHFILFVFFINILFYIHLHTQHTHIITIAYL